jgi:hypothetical protein
MALSTIGGKFKGVISKDQDLLDAAKHGNVEAIGKLTAKKRQSTASQFLPSTFEKHTFLSQTDLTRTGIISNSYNEMFEV